MEYPESIFTGLDNGYGFITDIPGLMEAMNIIGIARTDKDVISLLKYVLKRNNELAKSLTKKEKDLSTEKKQPENSPVKQEKEKKESITRIIDVTEYIEAIKKMESQDELDEILPSISDDNYSTIMTAIRLRLLEEKKAAQDFLGEYKDNENDSEAIKEEKRCAREELSGILKETNGLIGIINDYDKREKERIALQAKEKAEHNKVVFFSRTNGSSYIDDDIEDIDEGYCRHTISVLKSLQGEISQPVKRYKSADFKGLLGIRIGDIRVLYQRLDKDVVIVIGIMTKKKRNDQMFKSFLGLRANEYRLQEKMLKQLATNEEYLNDNQRSFDGYIEQLEVKGHVRKEGVQHE